MRQDELERRLLEAANTASELQREQWDAWQDARTARVNRDLCRAQVVVDAYANNIDGKNAEQRSAQLDAIILGSERLQAHEESLRRAEAEVKRAEGLLEVARVYRSALHDLVSLRVAELGVEAATISRQRIGAPKRKEVPTA